MRALHDGKQLAILLSWADTSHDATAIRPQDFRDAAAVAFSLTPDPPFFAMGQPGGADFEPAFQDIEKVYPNIGIDSYPNLLRSPLEQPTRHALTLQSDPTYVTAWGAGNIVADPTRKSAAEDLRAEGFGTLRARPRRDQNVDAVGVYETGLYHVQLRRTLRAGGRTRCPWPSPTGSSSSPGCRSGGDRPRFGARLHVPAPSPTTATRSPATCPVILGLFTVVAEPTPPWLAVSGLVLFAALVLAFARWRVRRLEVLYSSD